MARPFELAIAESEPELASLLKQNLSGIAKERVQMLWWVKSGQVKQHQELVRRLGRDGSTISRWLQKYRQGGLAALLEVKTAPGQTPIMSPAVQASLQAELAKESGFSSYGAIVDWLKQHHNLDMEYGTVYDWVHNRWGAKLKAPRPRSTKQSEARVSDFKKNSVSG
jgi:transposase